MNKNKNNNLENVASTVLIAAIMLVALIFFIAIAIWLIGGILHLGLDQWQAVLEILRSA